MVGFKTSPQLSTKAAMSRSAMRTRPKIGIDLDHEHDGRRWVYKTPAGLIAALIDAGAEPVLLPPLDPRPGPEMIAQLDGFLMSGGDDIHPAVVGQRAQGRPMTLLSVQRERHVLELARVLLEAKLPTLGVCLGCQVLNLAAGGDLYLDLGQELPAAIEHAGGAEHEVIPEPGGLLDRYWSGRTQRLLSQHHQAIKRLGPSLSCEAKAEDGVIEAFSAKEHPFLLGLQWHPELQGPGLGGSGLLERLVEAAGQLR